jgi:hypothetical protein
MSLLKNRQKMFKAQFFVRINTKRSPWKEVAHKFRRKVYFCSDSACTVFQRYFSIRSNILTDKKTETGRHRPFCSIYSTYYRVGGRVA